MLSALAPWSGEAAIHPATSSAPRNRIDNGLLHLSCLTIGTSQSDRHRGPSHAPLHAGRLADTYDSREARFGLSKAFSRAVPERFFARMRLPGWVLYLCSGFIAPRPHEAARKGSPHPGPDPRLKRRTGYTERSPSRSTWTCLTTTSERTGGSERVRRLDAIRAAPIADSPDGTGLLPDVWNALHGMAFARGRTVGRGTRCARAHRASSPSSSRICLIFRELMDHTWSGCRGRLFGRTGGRNPRR